MKHLLYSVVVSLLFSAFGASTDALPASGSPEPQIEVSEENVVKKVVVVSEETPQGVSGAHRGVKPPEVRMGMCGDDGCCWCKGAGMLKKGKKGRMHRPMLGGGHKMIKRKMHLRHAKGCEAGNLLHCAKELDLTDKQKEKLKDIAHKTRLAKIDLKAALAKGKTKLRKLIHEDAALKAIKAQMEAALRAEMDLKLKGISARKEAQKVLTDEQKEKLKSMGCGPGMMCCEMTDLGGTENIEIMMECIPGADNEMIKIIELEGECSD